MSEHEFDWTACLSRVREHDEAAAHALVERLQHHVEKIVRAHQPRHEDIEDLVQDVFLKVFTRLDQFRGQAPFEHWVARVAVTTCTDKLRAQRSRPVVRWTDLSEEQQAALDALAATDPPNPAVDTGAWEVLQKLLAALPPADRLLITLLELEERSISEVCQLTGWNSGVVRIRAFRARHKLKALWAKLEKGKL
jgi:RNA polymerase sigma-70 factor (ECF subfamily)